MKNNIITDYQTSIDSLLSAWRETMAAIIQVAESEGAEQTAALAREIKGKVVRRDREECKA